MNVDCKAALTAKTYLHGVEQALKSLSNFNKNKYCILAELKNIETKIDEIIDFETEDNNEC